VPCGKGSKKTTINGTRRWASGRVGEKEKEGKNYVYPLFPCHPRSNDNISNNFPKSSTFAE